MQSAKAADSQAQLLAAHDQLMEQATHIAVAKLPAQHTKQEEELRRLQAQQQEWAALLQLAQQRMQSTAQR